MAGDVNGSLVSVSGLEGRYRQLSSPDRSHHSAGLLHQTSSGGIVAVAETASILPPGRKYLRIRLLNGGQLSLALDVKERVSAVLGFVCASLGVEDSRLLGLSVIAEEQHRFLAPETRLKSIAPKNWRSQHGSGTDHAGAPLLTLHLRIAVFVDFVRLISCPLALEMYYLQLRENARALWTESQDIPEERLWEVAGLSLQADFGDYASLEQPRDYFRPELYFPPWILRRRGEPYIRRHAPALHRDLHGLSPHEARVRACREFSRAPCPLNLHSYGLRRRKADTEDTAAFVIATRGLIILDILESGRREVGTSLAWSQVAKLSFHRRRLSIGTTEGEKLSYYTASDDAARYLLSFAREVHQRTMALQARLVEACRSERGETVGTGGFRESYIYSDAREMGTTGTTLANGGAQRVSLASNASSGTTSGIVSDRGGPANAQPSDEEEEVNGRRSASHASLGIGSSRAASNDGLASQILVAGAPALPPTPSKAQAAIASQVSALLGASQGSLHAAVSIATQTEAPLLPSPPAAAVQKAVSHATQTSPAATATVLTINEGPDWLPPPPPSNKTLSLQNLSATGLRAPPDYAAVVDTRREPGKRPTTLSSIDPALIAVAAAPGGAVLPSYGEHQRRKAALGGTARAVQSRAEGLSRVASMPEHAQPPPIRVTGAGQPYSVTTAASATSSGLSRSTHALFVPEVHRDHPPTQTCPTCARDHSATGSARINVGALKEALVRHQPENFPIIGGLLRWKDTEAPPSPRPGPHSPPGQSPFVFPAPGEAMVEAEVEGGPRGVLRPLQPRGTSPTLPSHPHLHQGYEISLNGLDQLSEGARFSSTPNLSGTEMILPPPPPYPCRMPPSYAPSRQPPPLMR